MAEKIKVTEKELKAPDKFHEAVGSMIESAQKNSRLILFTFFAVLVVIIGMGIHTSNKAKNEAGASIKLNAAVASYKIDRTTENTEKVLAELKAINEDYSGTKSSQLAYYYAGIVNFEIEDYEQSRTLFEKFLDTGASDEILTDLAYLNIGMSSYYLEDWDRAIDYLIKVDKPGTPFRTHAVFHISKSYEKLGNTEKAREVYGELLGSF